MADFKIHDLTVLLQPGWADQTVGQSPTRYPVSLDPGLCGGSNKPDLCGGSNKICQASQLVVDIGCVSVEELKVLKKQLAQALEVVARREFELQSDAGGVEPMESGTIDALSVALKRIPTKRILTK
jgi:hypothetical protein